ncbi:thiol methyltransferase 1 [Jaminaea rosea]|uniref:Thiol methyltransferase 1 n=1 Tax=Jaminaea rosea TaxID=1569628 RepID=A0A316V1U5_9BASI|nr:thiol methyltransferase 1 [Jaminaea rosea]PWN30153.1 thiol methyltransferase 1 [Jaminaea rosea]
MTPDEKRKADVARLRSIMGDGLDQSFWSKAWQAKATPWDKGSPQPSLINFLTKTDAGKALVAAEGSKGSALVPGAGTGYDVEVFASLGWSKAVGVDIAPEAVESGKRWLAEREHKPYHEEMHFKVADFFEDPKGELTGFDLAYDYTFFCAIPPSLRPKWGEAYARSVKSGGHLICLVFPIEGDRPNGPPYSVSPELITQFLEPHFELQWQGVPPDQPEERKNIEQVMLWKRKQARG